MSAVVSINPSIQSIRCPKPLRYLEGWLTWRFESFDGEKKPRKVPFYCDGSRRRGKQGTPEDVARMTAFEAATASGARRNMEGVGFAPRTDFGITLLDFDNCVGPDGVDPRVERLVEGTYCEFSPSGTGVRAIVRDFGFGNRKPPSGAAVRLELFTSSGFCTFTGNRLPVCELLGDEDTIAEASPELIAFCTELFGAPRALAGAPANQQPEGVAEAVLADMLAAIPPGLGQGEGWLDVSMALHHETGGEGFDLWHSWCSGELTGGHTPANYPSREALMQRWDSFGRAERGVVTVRSLRMHALKHGWVENTASDFDSVPVPTEAAGEVVRDRPRYQRVPKTGEIIVSVTNVVMACRDEHEAGMAIAFDQFRDEVMFSTDGGENWHPFKDEHYVDLRMRLEVLGFPSVGRELIRDAVHHVAMQRRFDSAQLWLGRLTWDGAPRVASFLTRYLGCEANDYTRAVALYMWTAMAGRVLQPGCKADMVPVLYGPQGAGKSQAAAAIAPCAEFFTEISLGDKEADLARKMRGRLVAELAELRGLRTRELETIKAFITRTHEDWTPKFKEFNTTFPRRLLFIGTTNDEHFLADPTGNRRWLPLRVGGVDAEAIKRDRDQLWAEAATLFEAGGVQFKDAERLAGAVHAEHTMTDSWEETVRDWLQLADFGEPAPSARDFLRVGDVLTQALKIEPRNIKRADEMRVGAILCGLGYERKKMRVGGVPSWVYVPTCSHLAA